MEVCEKLKKFVTSPHLLQIAAKALPQVDSILFTSHLDSANCNRLQSGAFSCCNRTLLDKGRVPHLYPELVALREWEPLAGCPAQPWLRRGWTPRIL